MLVTSLVLMAILAIIGIATMRSNTTDVSIHKSMKNRANAFQCAEAAVRVGEQWLDELTIIPESVQTLPDKSLNQIWDYDAPDIQDLFAKDNAWWVDNGWSYGSGLSNPEHQIGCTSEPRYIVERIGVVGDTSNELDIDARSKDGFDFYRVTGYSLGTGNNAAVVVQTTFGKRLR